MRPLRLVWSAMIPQITVVRTMNQAPMDIMALALSRSNPNETTSDGAYVAMAWPGAMPDRVMKKWGSSRQLVNCQGHDQLLCKSRRTGKGQTNSGLDLSRADRLTCLHLAGVVTEDSLLQDLCLAFAKVPESEEGDRVEGRLREKAEEEDADNDGENTLDLNISQVRMHVARSMSKVYGVTCDEQPLPACQAANTSHVQTGKRKVRGLIARGGRDQTHIPKAIKPDEAAETIMPRK